MDEIDISNDSKYRAYVSNIDKHLKAFESSSEWADLISALGRLIKLLQQNAKYTNIPRKVVLGKRVSQCLHPALPAGVHLKALECYDVIFKNIGPQKLAFDLPIYCAGLFPLLSPSAMTVKPHLFDIYEHHFLPLGSALKPAFAGLLQGLLPGLEEGAEFFQRGNQVIERFCKAVGPSFFYTSLWHVMLQACSVRQYGIFFILNHFNKKLCTEDQLYFIGNSVDLMLQSLCAILGDSQVLVQRQALDFIILALPVHSQQLTQEDMTTLCSATLVTLLRRDMSLNRRLHSWLIGSHMEKISLCRKLGMTEKELNALEQSSESVESRIQERYFKQYGKELLTNAVKIVIKDPINQSGERNASIRPFRIVSSLMDKPELGSKIIEHVLLDLLLFTKSEYERWGRLAERDAMQNLSHMKPADSATPDSKKFSQQEDFLKTANLFFSNMSSSFLWSFVTRLFEDVITSHNLDAHESTNRNKRRLCDSLALSELCSLMEFLLTKFSLETYSEVHSLHLPRLLASLTELIRANMDHLAVMGVYTLLKIYKIIFFQILKHTSTALDMDHQADGSSSSIPDDPHHVGLRRQSSVSSNGLTRPILSSATDAMDSVITNFRSLFYSFCVKKLKIDRDQVNQYLLKLHSPPNWAEIIQPNKKFNGGPINENYFAYNFRLISLPAGLMDERIELAVKEEESLPPVSIPVALSVFSECCRLMVEMAGFPLSNTVDQSYEGDNITYYQMKGDFSGLEVPDWLGVLIVCACFVDNFHIKGSSVEALLEFCLATTSVYGSPSTPLAVKSTELSVDNGKPFNSFNIFNWLDLQKVTADSTNEIEAGANPSQTQQMGTLVFRALSPQFMTYLNHQTRFHSYVGLSLWQYLSEATSECHQRAVELLYELHQICPSKDICEEIILNEMLHEDTNRSLDAYRRFIVLWHMIRSHTHRKNGRSFDKCMFVLLDNIDSAENSIRSLSTSWLEHALRTGQCGRILEPILLYVLQPETARISICHLKLLNGYGGGHKTETNANTANIDDYREEESKIYAISSDQGNVTYLKKPNTLQNISKVSRSSAPNFVLDDGKGGTSIANSATVGNTEVELAYESVDPDNMHLRINPMEDESQDESHDYPPIVFQASESANYPNANCRNNKEKLFLEDGELPRESVTEVDPNAGDKISTSSVGSTGEPGQYNRIRVNGLNEMFPSTDKERSVSPNPETQLDQMLSDQSLLRDSPDSEYSIKKSDQQFPTSHSFPNFQAISPHIWPLHKHLLVYQQRYDARQVNYLLSRLSALVEASPKMILSTLATTTSLATPPKTFNSQILHNLLARHRKAISGENFYEDITAEEFSRLRNIRFLEVVITICVQFLRSVYSSELSEKVSQEDLYENKRVQTTCVNIINMLMREVILVLCAMEQSNESTDKMQDLRSYIKQLCSKCKLQMVIVHSLAASVALYQTDQTESDIQPDSESSKPSDPLTASTAQVKDFKSAMSDLFMTSNDLRLGIYIRNGYQLSLLRLAETMIHLDALLYPDNGSAMFQLNKLRVETNLKQLYYQPQEPLTQQTILLSSVVSALNQVSLRSNHIGWCSFVLNTLKFWGVSLQSFLAPTVKKLCRNLRLVAQLYESVTRYSPDSLLESLPPDYTRKILDCLQGVCHFCLLDRYNNQSAFSDLAPVNSPADQSLLTSFFSRSKESREDITSQSSMLAARQEVIGLLPRILSSLLILWQKCSYSESAAKYESHGTSAWILTSPQSLKAAILDFLSPLAVHHCPALLTAIALVWSQNRWEGPAQPDAPVPPVQPLQRCLIDIFTSVRSLPADNLIKNVRSLVVRPVSFGIQSKSMDPVQYSSSNVQTGLLHFLEVYCSTLNTKQMNAVWLIFQDLVRDTTQIPLTPLGNFLLLKMFHNFVIKVNGFEKKDQREVQDVKILINTKSFKDQCQRLIESVAVVAGSALEQPTWFRRNLQVKLEDNDQSQLNIAPRKSEATLKTVSESNDNLSASSRVSSIQALYLLSETMIALLDVVYKSEDKEKVAPFLNSTILPNVFPYLKHHSLSNLSSYRACSHLLCSCSTYQYTRRAWRKDAFELYMESNFFQMDATSFKSWKIIIDHLMTQDKNTFREALTRLTVTQSGGLNLFTSKEAEYELRASCMKKIAFIIFSSETDQYVKSMPEFQERLSDYLRLGMIPNIQSQTFLCFRVLLARMSQQHLTSLWHIFIPELNQVFLMLRKELLEHGLYISTHNMALYLSAGKLLDYVILLPESQAPQFLFYKWAFVGDLDVNNRDRNTTTGFQPSCTPIIIDIASLIMRLYKDNNELLPIYETEIRSNSPLFRMPSLSSPEPLYTALVTLSLRQNFHPSYFLNEHKKSIKLIHSTARDKKSDWEASRQEVLEEIMEAEFVEAILK